MLVVDASVVVPACLSDAGLDVLGDRELVAPPLLWSETRSVLHELAWRKEISTADALAAHVALGETPIRAAVPDELGSVAWRIADQLGWAKTYDAEYVALAEILDCRLVTLDGRLLRGAARLDRVVTPTEL